MTVRTPLDGGAGATLRPAMGWAVGSLQTKQGPLAPLCDPLCAPLHLTHTRGPHNADRGTQSGRARTIPHASL